jgi:hypothetical protein
MGVVSVGREPQDGSESPTHTHHQPHTD